MLSYKVLLHHGEKIDDFDHFPKSGKGVININGANGMTGLWPSAAFSAGKKNLTKSIFMIILIL
jgi:hypothetical protein